MSLFKRLAAWLGWMGLIFFLSSRGELGLTLRRHDLIRDALAKLAHVIEYGGLALLTRCVLRQCGAGSRWSSVVAVLFAALFGASDEWHQSFVPGREARATDVMIDAAGAALAMWLVAHCPTSLCTGLGRQTSHRDEETAKD